MLSKDHFLQQKISGHFINILRDQNNSLKEIRFSYLRKILHQFGKMHKTNQEEDLYLKFVKV